MIEILKYLPGLDALINNISNNPIIYGLNNENEMLNVFNNLFLTFILFFVLKVIACVFTQYEFKNFLHKRVGYLPLMLIIAFWFFYGVLSLLFSIYAIYFGYKFAVVVLIVLNVIGIILSLLSLNINVRASMDMKFITINNEYYEFHNEIPSNTPLSFVWIYIYYNSLKNYYIKKEFKKYNDDFNKYLKNAN